MPSAVGRWDSGLGNPTVTFLTCAGTTSEQPRNGQDSRRTGEARNPESRILHSHAARDPAADAESRASGAERSGVEQTHAFYCSWLRHRPPSLMTSLLRAVGSSGHHKYLPGDDTVWHLCGADSTFSTCGSTGYGRRFLASLCSSGAPTRRATVAT